ncbi:MAG TPA: hypothetical protein VFM75_07375 [Modicisalibacter sp.]|nr:hypothetical protein [Modicisalibacter sp.]
MNTPSDLDNSKTSTQNRLESLAMRSPDTARSSAEVELETDLASERDGRREDRFLFVVALIVIFDVWALQNVSTWTLPIVVGITQLFALLIFARRMGVEEIHFWLNQLLPRIKIGAREPEAAEQEQPAKVTDKSQADEGKPSEQ